MPEVINEKISKAVHDCLLRCCISSAPIATLAKFLAELRANPLWQDVEITCVEATVKDSLTASFRRPAQDAAQ